MNKETNHATNDMKHDRRAGGEPPQITTPEETKSENACELCNDTP